jgi:hypothetical protein
MDSIDSGEEELERILLKEGVTLSPEEIRELYDAIPELFQQSNPEFSGYLTGLQPRLEKVVDETASLKEQGLDSDALDVMIKFLETEEKNIGLLKDEKIKESLLAYIGIVLNTEQLAKEQTKVQLVSNGIDLFPVAGSMKMMYECANGKTAAGEKLQGTGRMIHGGMAVLSLATDAAAIGSAFVSGPVGPTVIESAKASVIGAESAVKGAKIASTIMRFAAICRKTGKLHNVSKTIFKLGVIVKKYPKVAGGILRFMKLKKNAGRLVKIGSRAYQTNKLKDPAESEDIAA